MFVDIALAVLSGLVLTLKAGFICPFEVCDPNDINNAVVVPGLMRVHLQPIPDAEYLPVYQWE